MALPRDRGNLSWVKFQKSSQARAHLFVLGTSREDLPRILLSLINISRRAVEFATEKGVSILL